jgi:hypothetical protein
MLFDVTENLEEQPLLDRMVRSTPGSELSVSTGDLTSAPYVRNILRALASAVDISAIWTIKTKAAITDAKIAENTRKRRLSVDIVLYGKLGRTWKCTHCTNEPLCVRGSPEQGWVFQVSLHLALNPIMCIPLFSASSFSSNSIATIAF